MILKNRSRIDWYSSYHCGILSIENKKTRGGEEAVVRCKIRW